MLKNPLPVSFSTHQHKRLLPIPSYAFAKALPVVPVVGAECAQAVHNFPMVFIPQGDGYALVGLLSLRPESNLFVGPDGRWMGSYVPAYLRQYPFTVGLPAEGGEPILCADEASGLLSETDGQPLFETDGSPAEGLRKMMEFVSEIERNRAVTVRAINAIAKHGLIVPWDFTLQQDKNQAQQKINGLFRVDEAAMNALPDEAFLELRKANALPVIYAHLLSLSCVEVLIRLSAAEAQATAAKKPPLTGAVDSNGDLVFNF